MTLSQQTPPPAGDAAGQDQLSCPYCRTVAPAQATFCGSCGERLRHHQSISSIEEQDLRDRYRLKTLLRRYPYGNLYVALDQNRSQTMVVIRDIDIAGLEKGLREQAVMLAHQEYDCLRRWRLPHTLACLDLRVFQGHLFLVTGLPPGTQEATDETPEQLHTLRDFLRSGQCFPGEAQTLAWTRQLGQAMEQLHRRHIILGDLDPSTIVLTQKSAQAEPLLMISWLWPDLRKLLPEPFSLSESQSTPYTAPEMLVGKVSARADVYSLGALLYHLLTGTPPDEAHLRQKQSLRAPREINARLSQHLEDCVMRALAVQPEERFPGMMAFLVALEHARTRRSPRKALPVPASARETVLCDVETIRMAPLAQRDTRRRNAAGAEHREAGARTARPLRGLHVERANTPARIAPDKHAPAASPAQAQSRPEASAIPDPLPSTPLPRDPADPIAAPPQAVARNPITPPPLPDALAQARAVKSGRRKKMPDKAARRSTSAKQNRQRPGDTLLRQMQRLVLGQPEQIIRGAAIIEIPQRIRPDQPYNLRLRLMGRGTPEDRPPGEPRAVAPTGLSALDCGESVQVEVSSVLQQGYTSLVQRARVTIPPAGYTVEITIPMQQQTIVTASRRERLHIAFLDGQRRPLYDRPFVVELFVSPLVQFGREGLQVLSIPV